MYTKIAKLKKWFSSSKKIQHDKSQVGSCNGKIIEKLLMITIWPNSCYLAPNSPEFFVIKV